MLTVLNYSFEMAKLVNETKLKTCTSYRHRKLVIDTPMHSKTEIMHKEGDMGVCGVAVLLIFLRGVAVNKIPAYGVAVIPNPAVCDVCVF